jgi:hypothetical protein
MAFRPNNSVVKKTLIIPLAVEHMGDVHEIINDPIEHHVIIDGVYPQSFPYEISGRSHVGPLGKQHSSHLSKISRIK